MHAALDRILVEDELLSVAKAASFLAISPRFVYSLAQRGDLQSVRIGGRVLIPRRAVIQFAADRVQVK